MTGVVFHWDKVTRAENNPNTCHHFGPVVPVTIVPPPGCTLQEIEICEKVVEIEAEGVFKGVVQDDDPLWILAPQKNWIRAPFVKNNMITISLAPEKFRKSMDQRGHTSHQLFASKALLASSTSRHKMSKAAPNCLGQAQLRQTWHWRRNGEEGEGRWLAGPFTITKTIYENLDIREDTDVYEDEAILEVSHSAGGTDTFTYIASGALRS
eukprot:TRINITY_DN24641_c0_g1_i1.p1 TRINITY_DN24641_c0_g1~~TRINITY_DN24641_c0_g1_i1.p1  ORF type:complete len:210 (-),score=31.91 TRINITY_DN24641_c0_g1_i1:71-700(-)